MKVLAINSSPRTGTGQSKTELMLNPLVEGMREAGAEVEVVDLRHKTIKYCVGCFTCWSKTPGVCIHKDDMSKELFPKWLAADIVVYATPLYNYTVTAHLKAFIERTIPSFYPYVEVDEDRCYHPLRWPNPNVVVLSVAGFPDEEHFGPLAALMKYYYATPGRKLLGEIYRTASETLTTPIFKAKRDEIFDATRQAGRELIQSKAIDPETLDRITQPLMEGPPMPEMANWFWRTLIAQGKTPKEFEEQGIVPRPDTLETYMLVMKMGFNPKGAQGLDAVIEYRFSGDVEGSCHFVIKDGEMDVAPGAPDKADLTIIAPFNLWMDILTGMEDGQQAFADGKYQVEGDLEILLKFKEIFGK